MAASLVARRKRQRLARRSASMAGCFSPSVISFSHRLHSCSTNSPTSRSSTVLEQRRQKIAEGLANAEKIKEQLAESEKRYQEILTKANAEAQKMIDEARAARQDAQADAATSKRSPRPSRSSPRRAKQRSSERAKMLAEFKREVARLVVDTTAKVTGKVLDRRRSAPPLRRSRARDRRLTSPGDETRQRSPQSSRKQLFQASFTDGRLDEAQGDAPSPANVGKSKPRHYVGHPQGLPAARPARSSPSATRSIESAAELDQATREPAREHAQGQVRPRPHHRIQSRARADRRRCASRSAATSSTHRPRAPRPPRNANSAYVSLLHPTFSPYPTLP